MCLVRLLRMMGTVNKHNINMTIQQIKLLRLVADSIIAGVAAAGSLGCPGGTLYAALMAQGCTLQQFEGITDEDWKTARAAIAKATA